MKESFGITSRRGVRWAIGVIACLIILLMCSLGGIVFAQGGGVADHVVISEVQVAGATSTDEFIELYNPLGSPVDMTEWRLSRMTAGGTKYNLLTTFPTCTIPAYGYFLIAHPSVYTDTRDAAYSTAQYIARNNTVLLYSDAGLTVVDMVGMGSATISETATISNPVTGGSIERKAQSSSTAETMGPGGVDEFRGNGYDSDDNSQDFVLRAISEPQNSSSPAEYPPTALVVTSTADTGPGTLRQAMLDAVSGDTIVFDTSVFPPTSPVTISLQSALPEITQGNLTIDGSNAGVILDGSALSSAMVFHITSNGNVIKGLQILYFPGNGIWIDSGASYNLIGGSNASPGGTCSGDCNLISGSGHTGGVGIRGGPGNNGVRIQGSGTTSNTVSGNYIGTDASGTVAIPNAQNGVSISDGASYNLIGGDTAGERNVISGNGSHGVSIKYSGTRSNTVSGNYIGTDASGTGALGNTFAGVYIADGASDNIIGGVTITEGNIIAYNDVYGVYVEGASTLSNTISHNSIHSNADKGIELSDGGNLELSAPTLTEVASDTVKGVSFPEATIEVFSDLEDEGQVYEGTTIADTVGHFTFTVSATFSLTHVTATATDAAGNTSEFGRYFPYGIYLPVVVKNYGG